MRRTELTRLKVSDIDSRRMVVHIQGGKGQQDGDLMLSPVLLEELRAHWRRLRKKSVWLFLGNCLGLHFDLLEILKQLGLTLPKPLK